MSARSLRIAGLHLTVDVRAGDGRRPPLLLCPGLGADLEMFEPLIDVLNPGLEIIRFDVPGIGRSPTTPLPLGFASLAGVLAAVLDELGHRRVDLLGYSWGGALAQQFAVQHPARCRRLVLVSTTSGAWSIPGDLRLLSVMLTPPGFPAPRGDALPEAILDESATRREELLTLLRISRRSATGLGYLHQLMAVSTWTSVPFLPLLSQPTLVMGGDDDPIAPAANSRLLAGLIRRSELAIFPGGHGEIITAPAGLAPTISRFLHHPQ